MIEFPEVTRFEVIDYDGRAFVGYDVKVQVALQDDGRTMKVFVRQRGFLDR